MIAADVTFDGSRFTLSPARSARWLLGLAMAGMLILRRRRLA